MSTLASLMSLLGQSDIKPYNEQELTANRIQFGNTQNQTQLLELAELRRQQASAANYRQAIANNPDILLNPGGGSTLASLNAGGPPGAITQGPLPGMPGQTQTIGAPQDLSQFASGPPAQSTIAGLAPAPPQDPVRALLQRDPEAGLKLLDMREKMQERTLGMQEKKMAYFGQLLQGATDQASWDQAREQIGKVDQQAAAAMGPLFNTARREQMLEQALSRKESLTLQVQDLQAQAAVIKARKEGRSVDVDNQLRAMGVQPGEETPAQIKKALQAVEDAKVRVSASHGTGQIVKGPTGEYIRVKPGTDQVEVIRGPGGEPLREKPSETEQKGATLANSVASANTLATALEEKGYKPSVWDKGMEKLPLGLGNYLTSSDYQQYRQAVREFASAWLYGVSGAQITDSEWENANQTFFPQPNEDKGAVELKRQRRAALVEQLRQQTQATGRTGTQGQATSQAPLKPVGEMSREELLAERDRLRTGGS